jgi:HAMP domain-containing protein
MRLLLKFSVVYVLIFGLGIGAAAFIFYDQLHATAREQVLHHAQIIMEAALAMRNYTTEQVRPAFHDADHREDEAFGGFRDLCARRASLKAAQDRKPAAVGSSEEPAQDPFRDVCTRRPAPTKVFRPQTVPAFAATEIFNYLSRKYPEYVYKEATLNPTNPRDRAVDWEEDIIKAFRNRPELTTVDGERNSPLGRSFFLARPMRAAKSCLECHSIPAAAPAEMVSLYGTANGFGWKEGEVIAAQIVSVPVAVSSSIADRAFQQLLTSLGVVAIVTLVVLNLVLLMTVILPISRFARLAEDASRGNLEGPELPVKGRDELSTLAEAFNRMRRSLLTAMNMVEKP